MYRSAFLILISGIVTGLTSLFVVSIYPFLSRGEFTIHKVARKWARILLAITGVDTRITGSANVFQDRPQIFMANHQSVFDILVVLAYIPAQFRWIAKKELFEVPVFGDALRRTGSIQIDRQDHTSAVGSIDEAARKIREGKSVMTYPEGTRSPPGQLRPFKKGVFHLALKAGVPIVPIAIIGSGEVMAKKSMRIRTGKILLVVDKPIMTAEYSVENIDSLIERVHEVIRQNYEEGRKEMNI
jgi:1-acyl-sn-glycerol-3-phosphate acyltransferase